MLSMTSRRTNKPDFGICRYRVYRKNVAIVTITLLGKQDEKVGLSLALLAASASSDFFNLNYIYIRTRGRLVSIAQKKQQTRVMMKYSFSSLICFVKIVSSHFTVLYLCVVQ